MSTRAGGERNLAARSNPSVPSIGLWFKRDPETGRDWGSRSDVLQHLKQLWHVLVHFRETCSGNRFTSLRTRNQSRETPH